MLDTIPAPVTIFGDLQTLLLSRGVLLCSVKKTGMAGHHYGRAIGTAVFDRFLQQGDEVLDVVRIGNAAKCHTTSLNQGLEIYGSGTVHGRRGWLVARHGGGSVVENDQYKTDILGHRIDEGRDTGMEKCGIANGCHDVRWFFQVLVSMIKACRLTDGRSHAQDRMDSAKIQAERVTADIAGLNTPGNRFLDGKKTGPVGTPGTQRGPTPGGGFRDRLGLG